MLATPRRAHLAAAVVANARAVLTEPELLRAMFDVGYFPQNTRYLNNPPELDLPPRAIRTLDNPEVPP
jgi:hypothetical protein